MAVLLSQLRLVTNSLFVKRSEVSTTKEGLLSVEQVPDVLKEPYIFTGYRPIGRPWKYYICSLLLLHNELINVWTHTIGFFIVLFRLMFFFSKLNILEDKEAWPVLGFGVCCLLSLTLSAAAHLFHSRSKWHHFVFFLMDYMGVTFYSFGTGIVSMFTCSSRGYHDALRGWYLPGNVLLSWFSFYACCIAITHLSHDNMKRKSMILVAVSLQGFFVSLPLISRYVECILSPNCSIQSLNHMTLVFLIISLCGAVFAGHCPESWFPGCFDILGHGHQIFHVLIVVVMLLELRLVDIEVNVIGTAKELQPNLAHICLAFMTLVFLEAVTMIYHVQFIYFNRLSQEIPRQDVQVSLLNKDEMVEQETKCELGYDTKKSN